jgi:histidine triad (HIT) family protein
MMEDCIFCKIANKEIKADLVYEDAQVVAFSDIAPQSPVHILVIPKRHVARLSDLLPKDAALVADLFAAIQKLVKGKKLEKDGYRVIVNEGKNAGQAVWHLHFHLLAGRRFSWPPG